MIAAPYDVLIVGAGPSGSTTAYYSCEYAKKQNVAIKVALLEKATFPRDKYCGDAWCAPALDILEDMQVLQRLQAQGLVNETKCGGFVSPNGYSFIANDRGKTDPTELDQTARAFAIKRIICDEAIARRAVEVGAELHENALVDTCTLDETTNLWTIRCADGRKFHCRLLICADGAASNVARKLGIVLTAPDGVAARQYIKGGTHNFKADGVLLYPEYTLPGYMALFRHYDDSIDLGAYLLPGGAAKESDIAKIYSERIKTDPFISRALGKKWEPLERVKVASLRLGGVEQSYSKQLLIVGDAAGHIDPLTGEGIHLGMMAAKKAAAVGLEMLTKNDFTLGKKYHEQWWKLFGSDFPVSSLAGRMVYKAPFLMDAVPIAAAAKGSGKSASDFFAAFGAVMTGALPKTTFLLPWVAFPLFKSTLFVIKNQLFGIGRLYFEDPLLVNHEEELNRPTSWESQCLIDPHVNLELLKASPEEKMDQAIEKIFKWGKPDKDHFPVLVAYGSEYGYSAQICASLCDALKLKTKCMPRLIDLKYYSLVDWQREKFVFIVCSTAGDGEFPVEVREFFSSLKPQSMLGLKFAVLAPGDSAYPHFCKAGKSLNEKMETLCGAKPVLKVQEMDGENSKVENEWIDKVCLIVEQEQAKVLTRNYLDEDGNDYLHNKARQSGGLLLEEERATRNSPFVAKLKSRRMLSNPKMQVEDKIHISIDISDSAGLLAYTPGDALGILPSNDPKEMDLLISCLPALTREALGNYNLKDSTIELLNLLKLNMHSLTDPFVSERWVYDLVCESLKNHQVIDVNAFLACLKPLQPRLYSIVSSPLANPNEVHLCVAVVRYKVNGNRSTGGVASTWLCDRLQVGDEIKVFVQRNPDFRLPKDKGTAKIMIGPGTGIAPFISFLRHEIALGLEDEKSSLFFGCRHVEGDFLYREELEIFGQKKHKKLITAFSRDQEEKIYVQHKIRQEAMLVWDALDKENGKIYICGDGWRMAADVHLALVDVCFSKGKFNSREEADEFVKKRTSLDVWVV